LGKPFFEAIPGLEVPDEMRELLKLTTVEKVKISKDRTNICIYLTSPRLIQKKNIFNLEGQICRQLFPDYGMTVKIIERYTLSAQYTPEKFWELYYDSALLELKSFGRILGNLLRDARVRFTGEHTMSLTLPDNIVTRDRERELREILEKIFNERCGFGVQVDLVHEVRQEAEPPAENERMIDEMAREIVSRSSFGQGAVQGRQKEEAGGNERAGKQKTGAQKGASSQGGGTGKGAAENAPAGPRSGGGPGGQGKSGERRDFFRRKPSNPDVLWGRDFDDEAVVLSTVIGEMGEIAVNGKVITLDKRELRSGNYMLIFDMTDFTDTITVKMFIRAEAIEELEAVIRPGSFLKIKGVTNTDKFDGELVLSSVSGIRKGEENEDPRRDLSEVKRVELHCHTKMSDMDGVSTVTDIIKQAKKFGHKALAITDHGCVQAFTEASHAVKPDEDFKLIYGVEGYLVDDLQEIVTRCGSQTLEDTFVVFDIETTGLSALKNQIIEIGAVKIQGGEIRDRFSTFVNPGVPIPFEIEKLTHINDAMVMGSPSIEEALPRFLEFAKDAVMVAHNASFDMGFMEHNARQLGREFKNTYVDTVGLARVLLPQLSRYKLDTVAKALNISLEHHHRAVDDAGTTAEIFLHFQQRLAQMEIRTLEQINGLSHLSDDALKKLKSYHIIILAKNDTGRINLYRLVSASHLRYFARQPRIPKSLLARHREGLIIGSACEAGELFRAVADGASDEDLAKIVRFYDYLEVQPLGNNEFMLRDEKSSASTMEDLMEFNRKIIGLGEQFKKPVVATGDVHFLNPEDGIYRQIIMAGKGFKDTDNQAPLYYRTTEEMLKEFEYLGSDKAYEVVVENTNRIANMCERISPVRPDKCPPVIPDSDKQLRQICYNRAHEIYGEELPPIVSERLERELNSIISNGFAVMYIIAQKLVWKSNEDGYLVGSRGSVGSSFVATMAGITEVNPLSPHYYCADCHYYDFDSEEVKAFAGMAGCDMPDKVCPDCGKPLKKEGFDIPFETFLGFKGNKEPDIDLNFSGEYQPKAHKYTEIIFGAGQTFRAGTTGTLADKTAYGFVKNYYEERGRRKRKCEINRITQGCVGVRRTTGQHPGGIIVLPYGEEIDSFTPVQHPANDMTTDIVTTHFDYHSIDHNLLKLDILGHDDPTMIRMLENMVPTFRAQEIPLDSKEVMSLFMNTEALGIRPEDISGCQLGALGIPEFGTDFAMQMLIDAQPRYFSDLVRIAGLAHGTDVWLGNAQTLIKEGTATIRTAICTRDDIMIYLISMGMEPSLSFDIMEKVRKGKGLTPDWEKAMRESNVPQWYIDSCNKIKYMFPKAHAAAYVMMAWRIAYYKIYHPLAYYAAFFSIRASGFSYELMCLGQDKLKYHLAEYRGRLDTLTPKEQSTLRDMRIVEEMYARGYDFMPIDLFRAKARDFQIIDGKLMPALNSIEGLGVKAAEAIVEAAKDGPFLSLEDFYQRTKVNKSIMDQMAGMGMFGDIPRSNQISLFDLMEA
jgi:DNA polymerase-3 subunit alpha (Gram-positive type)